MNKFKISNEIFITDGSFEGLLTIVHFSYKNKIIPKDIIYEKDYIPNLFDEPIFIETNYEKAQVIYNIVKTKIGDAALYTICTSFLSKSKNKYKIIYDFIYYGFKYGGKINNYRTLPVVTDIQKMVKNVKNEAHKFKGFVRFSKTDNGIFYSKIKPDNDILEMVANHFKYRLKNESWVIIDEGRCKGAFYNKCDIEIVDNIEINSLNIKYDSEEEMYRDLWKKFYNSVSINERKNRKCMLSFMPKKYWKNMLEVENE